LSDATEKDDCAQVYDDSSSVYSATNFGPHSDSMAVRRKSLACGPPKSADKHMTVLKTATPVAVAAASSSARGIDWSVLSTADAWNSSQRVTEVMECLKIGKPIRKISPLFLLMPQSLDIFY
jgi:hypothetical protein